MRQAQSATEGSGRTVDVLLPINNNKKRNDQTTMIATDDPIDCRNHQNQLVLGDPIWIATMLPFKLPVTLLLNVYAVV